MDEQGDFTVDCQCKWDDNYWVQGRGTSRAIRGCRANFDIHLIEKSQLINLTVEIKGPENTICFEKINQSEDAQHPLRGSNFKGRPFQLGGPKGGPSNDSTLIPMWYSTVPGKISIYYIPLVIGIHKIRLFSRLAQIRGSPFTVYVDEGLDGLKGTNKKTNNNCSLARSFTFCQSAYQSIASNSFAGAEHRTRNNDKVAKNHPTLTLLGHQSENIRRSKSSELISSSLSSSAAPTEPIESVWDRPSVSGIEYLEYLSESCKEDSSASSSASDVDNDEDNNDDDDYNDDAIVFSSDYFTRGCSKCCPYFIDKSQEPNGLVSSDQDYLLEAMNQRYQEEHFKKHSFRVQSLIEYWNKMSFSSIGCSEDSKCNYCAQAEEDNRINQ